MKATLCGALMVLVASIASAQEVRSAPRSGPSLSDWTSQVIAILERNKRYPPRARSNHLQGSVHLAFATDRRGRVSSAHIDRSSRSAVLDAEALALVHRVSIPPPPAELLPNATQINFAGWLNFRLLPNP
jgi:TonB family protein